jgi:hypothetical protein
MKNKKIIFSGIIFALLLIAPVLVWAQAKDTFVPVEPKLQIPIPNLTFTKTSVDGGYVSLPWLADYIAATYKYGVGIVSFIAIIMIMVGGLRWTTAGGNASAVTSAKQMISGAVIGMILALGSYLILYSVNPDLVSFKNLQIKLVGRQELDLLDRSIASVQGDTAPEAGAPTPSFNGCPIALTEPAIKQKNSPRTKEFQEKIGSVITGSTVGEKIIQVAEAAAKCGVNFGYCGLTADTIYKLAANTSIYSKGSVKTISKEQTNYLATMKCQSDTGCNYKEKISQVFQKLSSEIGNGWPDSWANKLKPGDVIVIFNANSADTYGTHSAIFMGWTGGGMAQIIEGGTPKGYASQGSVCLKSGCSDPKSLVRIRTY